jgi:hypothetical protein
MLHTIELPHSCCSYHSSGTGTAGIVSELSVGFEGAAASNFTQRASNAISEILIGRMDATEAPFIDNFRAHAGQAFKVWLAARDRLSVATGRNQARLFTCDI